MYEYKTFVNSSSNREDWEESSFVTFDFNGVVEIEITSNIRPIISAIIRPQSRALTYTQLSTNKVSFFLSKPDQLSFEINGDRYKNMQIFANPIEGSEPANITKRFRSNVINDLSGYEYVAQDGDVIYFEPGAIVKGRIFIKDGGGVKIMGRGIIDLSHLKKQYYYPNEYGDSYEYIQGIFIRNSHNLIIKDVLINDSQAFCMDIVGSSNIDIQNVKMFSRVLWGDGIDMSSVNNVKIKDSFIRTSDDAIVVTTKKGMASSQINSYNIEVDNTSLYADAAHPIQIGFSGSQDTLNRSRIFYLKFNNIDILEHDEPLMDYQGAISINCSDENSCTDISFWNIRVEDFTDGRLLNIKVEFAGYAAATTNGYRVRNIGFINLTYNGFGENSSIIKGLNCERFVDGVKFHDFRVNGHYILKLSDYNFYINPAVYNITFQEANNFSKVLAIGTYRIRNKQNNRYLTNLNLYSPTDNEGYYVATGPLVSLNNSQKWQLTRIDGHYRIKNIGSNNFLHNSDEAYVNDCKNRYIWSYPQGYAYSTQEWKIVPKGNGYYTINNDYTHGYLQPSLQTVNGNGQSKYLIDAEKSGFDEQLWIFELVNDGGFEPIDFFAKGIDDSPILSPVPFSQFIQIDNLKNISEWSLTDINGKVLESGISGDTDLGKTKINTSKLNSGIYYFNAVKFDGELLRKTVVKR